MTAPPRMHGRTHCPGGSDPIPCLTEMLGGTSFSDGVIALGETRDLLGYWRLGDGPGTFADTNPYLAPLDQIQHTTGATLTTGVTGGLDASQDDGAVQFNGAGTTTGDWLRTTTTSRFALAGVDMSVACWVNPILSASSFSGGIVGTASAGVFTTPGWGLFLDWPAMTVRWQRCLDSVLPVAVTATIGADAWYFLVATYNAGDGMALYVDGALAATDPTTFSQTAVNDGCSIGRLQESSLAVNDHFSGVIDEVSVWGATLTPDEIFELYTDSGTVSGSAPIGPAGGDLTGSFPDPELETIGSATGPIGDGSTVPVVTIDAKGRVTALTSAAITAGDPATDTKVWMPLTTTVGGDDVLVFDASHQLIPTLTAI